MPFLVLSQSICHCLDLAAKQNEKEVFFTEVVAGHISNVSFTTQNAAQIKAGKTATHCECQGRVIYSINGKVKISKCKLAIKHR